MGDFSGTISYDLHTNKPTYEYTAATTEFDDICIQRGIISKADAIRRKGATVSEAVRLAAEFDKISEANVEIQLDLEKESSTGSEDDESSTDEVLEAYRRKRMEELSDEKNAILSKRKRYYGSVFHISRPDWNREVNEESKNGQWVIINLTCDAVWNARVVEHAIRELAQKHDYVKFVSIKSTSAIEGWPDSNLPTLFLYRDGVLQKQCVGIDAFGGAGVNVDRIEWRLANLGVLKSELQEEPSRSKYDKVGSPNISLEDKIHQLSTNDRIIFDPFDDVD